MAGRSADGDWFYCNSDGESFVDPEEILAMYEN